MHRFYLPPQQLHSEYISLPEPLAHQVRNVLRMRVGDVFTIFDGEGMEYDAEIADIHRDGVTVQLGDPRPCIGEPRLHLTLFHSLLKKDRFEWALEKGTELGVSHFVPMHTARVIADGASEIKRARWQRVVIEAAELAGRGICRRLTTFTRCRRRLRASKISIWRSSLGKKRAATACATPCATIALCMAMLCRASRSSSARKAASRLRKPRQRALPAARSSRLASASCAPRPLV
jgi:RsmE family RNA methyltransferase